MFNNSPNVSQYQPTFVITFHRAFKISYHGLHLYQKSSLNNWSFIELMLIWNLKQCTHTCGKGVQHRRVTCHRVNAYGWSDPEPVSHGCNVTGKPEEMQQCVLAECRTRYMWAVEPWGEVSNYVINILCWCLDYMYIEMLYLNRIECILHFV